MDFDALKRCLIQGNGLVRITLDHISAVKNDELLGLLFEQQICNRAGHAPMLQGKKYRYLKQDMHLYVRLVRDLYQVLSSKNIDRMLEKYNLAIYLGQDVWKFYDPFCMLCSWVEFTQMIMDKSFPQHWNTFCPNINEQMSSGRLLMQPDKNGYKDKIHQVRKPKRYMLYELSKTIKIMN